MHLHIETANQQESNINLYLWLERDGDDVLLRSSPSGFRDGLKAIEARITVSGIIRLAKSGHLIHRTSYDQWGDSA